MIRTVAIVVAVALVAALAPWPYDYYRLLRVVTFAAGIYCGALLWNEQKPLALALFVCALIFNPIIPTYLSRPVWAVLDLGGAAIFLYASYRGK
jgi:hypothetical protein